LQHEVSSPSHRSSEAAELELEGRAQLSRDSRGASAAACKVFPAIRADPERDWRPRARSRILFRMSTNSRPETPLAAEDARLRGIARLVSIVDRLRAPDGCPWDRKQTIESMAPHLVEEAYEMLEAIESARDGDTAEEAGDVLMVIALICRIAEQTGRFDLATAANAVSDKLVRRHPHVFGEVKADSAEQVVANWEAIKKAERGEKEVDDSALAGVPIALPALQRAQRICGKAVTAGFRWSSVKGAIAKLAEEKEELDEALAQSGAARDPNAPIDSRDRARIEHELGDVLLAAAFLGTYLKMDPEKLCRDAVRRFERRFRAMEAKLERPMSEQSLESLIHAWNEAKLEEG
jgi:MazG family protein